MNNFKFALRRCARNPGATFVVVTTLAVAIAAGTIIASTIDTVRHLVPAARSDRLVFVASSDTRSNQLTGGSTTVRTGVSIPDLVDWSERTAAFDEFAAFTFGSANLTGMDVPLRLSTARVTQNLPDVWNIQPILGRSFRADEAHSGSEHVALLTDAFWERQFSRTQVLGRTLMLDGQAYTVIGVLPAAVSTGLFNQIDLMTPLVLDRERARRDERNLHVAGVLKAGITRERAAADLESIAGQLQKEYPGTNAKAGVMVRPLVEMVGFNIPILLILLGVIATLLVAIACANVSNIVLAQTLGRRRELSVRSALGASRFDQVRQLMTESFLLSSIAGAAGLMLAGWGLMAIRLVGSDMIAFSQMTVNGRVLGAAVAVAFVAPFGFALLPAIRMSTPDIEELRQGTRGGDTGRGRRLREVLVSVQMALAMILMIQVGLLIGATWKIHNLEKGFDPAQVLTLRIDLSSARYSQPRAAHDFFAQALDRIRSLPGVVTAGATSRLPIADREVIVPFAIAGVPTASDAKPKAARAAITVDFLKTLRIPVVRGRGFGAADFGNAAPVALVNAQAARTYWPNQSPIGQRVTFDVSGKPEWLEVIGVVGNVRNSDAGLAAPPQMYVPSSWRSEQSMAILVRTTSSDPIQLATVIRTMLAELDKDQPVHDVKTMSRVLFDDLGASYLLSGMLAVVGLIVLLLSAAGVYGLVSYSVSQQTREIGLRMALGAHPRKVLGMMVAQGSRPIAFGLALGAVGSGLLTYFTSGTLEDIDLRDPIGYLVVLAPLVALALLALYVPARRATHVDPMLALRAE